MAFKGDFSTRFFSLALSKITSFDDPPFWCSSGFSAFPTVLSASPSVALAGDPCLDLLSSNRFFANRVAEKWKMENHRCPSNKNGQDFNIDAKNLPGSKIK